MNFLVEQMCYGITPFNSMETMCDVVGHSPHMHFGQYRSSVMQDACIVGIKQAMGNVW